MHRQSLDRQVGCCWSVTSVSSSPEPPTREVAPAPAVPSAPAVTLAPAVASAPGLPARRPPSPRQHNVGMDSWT